MSPVSWASDKATVTVPGVFVERGTQYDDWDNPAAVFELSGLFEPGPGEVDAGAYAVEVTGTFLARGRRAVPQSARVEVVGAGVFGLAADGQRWRSPTGALSHVQLVLTKWEVR
ncbi:hypothetical protein [Brachybacterium sp.]|uniref:hypothetical protein n=1 Tax=Brachybacterium sp. TaxID=1891286 RepID=UPI002ED3721D